MTGVPASPGVYVGVDIGGTKVLAGVVDSNGQVGRTAGRTTPGRTADVRIVEDALVDAVLDAADGRTICAVGVAAAGFVDVRRQSVRFAPHLPWRGEPLRESLERRWGAPVVLDNDANAAAWAEWRFGAARGSRALVMVTLGTGIGGALVLDGDIYRGAGGMAGEFGHHRVVPGGRPCECGLSGCWEQYASGQALVRAVRDRVASDPTLEGTWTGERLAALTGPMVTQAAGADDPVAVQAFAEVGEWLGWGMATLVAALDPDLIVVGGGVSDAGELLLAPARETMRRRIVGAAHRITPDVLRASLGPQAGLIGAAELARSQVAIQQAPRCGP